MDEYLISLYDYVKLPEVTSQIPITAWFNMIAGCEFSSLIEDARNGVRDYNEIKLYEIPCVTINCNYGSYKNTKNSLGSTGLMYIDIDAPDFNIKDLDENLVMASYKSFGGKGYGIVVRVDGITENNFHETYKHVCHELGIYQYADFGACKMTQFNALTYDPTIRVNLNSKIFSSINPLSETKREREAYSTDRGVYSQHVRFDNKDTFFEADEDYIINWEGINFIEAKVLFKKVSKNRNNILLSYCNNLVYLNPNIYDDRLYRIMCAVNDNNFHNPVDRLHLNRIVDSILTYRDDGSLKPIYPKKIRNLLFNPKSKLSKEEKFTKVREFCAEKKIKQSNEKLENIIANWDFKLLGTITQLKIVKNNPISKKTVEKYYHKFKENIKLLNSQFGS